MRAGIAGIGKLANAVYEPIGWAGYGKGGIEFGGMQPSAAPGGVTRRYSRKWVPATRNPLVF